ncbi:hypothetical protein AQUCO_00800098v1 [Aquilegia coerulea]|uniref:Flavin-containing monooxygenase n=1 Tax=Aquilegia coerulea TaxID=218851 RepID=A0A2G5EH88_AQUCA|nr:hypothetical protein AQUCO_00800098v1 [Aquilegia coerulea]
MEEVKVVIVGASPSGLAASACLKKLMIDYDRLKLHLSKEFCHLPNKPFPSNAPTYISREQFIQYIDDYVWEFDLHPRYNWSVQSASYDEFNKKWCIEAKNTMSRKMEVYIADFLVVATGENSEGVIPKFPGLERFVGESVHSSQYKSGSVYKDKDVLVVGSGNSGMEIAYDLYNHVARTSIVVKSQGDNIDISEWYGARRTGMSEDEISGCYSWYQSRRRVACCRWEVRWKSPGSARYLSHLAGNVGDFGTVLIGWVDNLIMFIARLWYGDLSKHGIRRPSKGPFSLRLTGGRSPVVDVGTVGKIVNGDIKVFPAVSSIENNDVVFANGEMHDAIIFATGYRSTTNNWLKDYEFLLTVEGMPKNKFPDNWKGLNGLYCAGLGRLGLVGTSMDAQAIANDIKLVLAQR